MLARREGARRPGHVADLRRVEATGDALDALDALDARRACRAALALERALRARAQVN